MMCFLFSSFKGALPEQSDGTPEEGRERGPAAENGRGRLGVFWWLCCFPFMLSGLVFTVGNVDPFSYYSLVYFQVP